MTHLEIWKELSRIAFVGSERAFLEKELLDRLHELGIDLDQDITGIMLDSAALFRIGKKAGFPLQKLPLPTEKAAIQENVRYISSAANRFLISILHNNTLAVQLEFIELIKTKKLFLPPEYLPALLTHPAISSAFKLELPFITDKKGHWLLNQNPEWQYLISVKNKQVWQFAGKEEREVMFYHIRLHYPELAGDYFAAVWNEISITERKSLLNQYKNGLSEQDIPYLERWWSPKDKNLAPVISGLLLQLSGSQLAQSVWPVILESLQLEKGINGLEQLVWTDITEKLDKLTFVHPETGSEVLLKQVTGDLFKTPLVLIPPTHWETKFNKTPEEILKLIEVFDIVTQGTHYINKALFQLAEAAVTYTAVHWIKVLTAITWKRWQCYSGTAPDVFLTLFSASPEVEQDEIVFDLFQKQSSLTPSISARLLTYLLTTSYCWKSPDIRSILSGLSKNQDFGLNYYETEALIKGISLRSQAVMIEPLLAAFENEPLASGKFQSAIRAAIPILRWRYQLQELLK